ncbi:DUF881 domain-containing protein [Pengzhenrongella phosphoraccumulans]|uniref:DUF881 domain-containing protein n=1 Tax=Pengzhenrongella phosphoraccumulans TaxID=3114394 RepID=UPI00388D4A09
MTDRMRHRTLRALRGPAAVGMVLALAGLLFTANARLARGQEERHPQNLGELAQVESTRVESLTGDVENLRAEVDKLTKDQVSTIDVGDPAAAELVSVVSGQTAMSGPGVTVEMTDAPAGRTQPELAKPDDLVVHQQDLQAVINALWAGGAEAMTLQDQRVVATTVVLCNGNVLQLGGRLYSPPYVIRAIGDPKALKAALFHSDAILTFLDYVDWVGLGWSLTTEDNLDLPAAAGTTELKYATVPRGTKVFP